MEKEENFITVEQAKELQELGIDFTNANTWFCRVVKNWNGEEVTNSTWRLVFSKYGKKSSDFDFFEYLPILSIGEMLKIIPQKIKCIEDGLLEIYYLLYDGQSIRYVQWMGSEITSTKIKILLKTWNFRDALFEMIKWLKLANLI